MAHSLYVDGASSGNPGAAGAGVLILDDAGQEVFRESIFLGQMTNNMAEYEALVRGLRRAQAMALRGIQVFTDSELVARQVSGEYRVRDEKLRVYVLQTRDIAGTFKEFTLRHIPREQNRIADKLAKEAIKARGRRVAAPFNGEESPDIGGQDGP
jgi:ribonuclease HI